MKENINKRIIKILDGHKYGKEVSQFLIEAIREEFQRGELSRWKFADVYNRLISKYAEIEDH